MQTFETDRLVLRPFTPDDQQFVHEVHTHPGIARFIPGQVSRSSEATRAQTERFMSLADHPVHGFWCVTLADGTPVALVMFKPVPFSEDSPRAQEEQDVEIGWRQHPDHGGHGYVTEAAARVLEHAWASGLQRVVAVTDPENHASMGVCRRLGMVDAGPSADYYDKTTRLFVATPEGSP